MTTTSKLPAFEVIAITGEGDTTRYTRIGAAWAAKSGKGFNIQLDALPLGQSLILRPRKNRDDAEGGAQ